jgi:nucleoside-diphosphate-sugar epimerase
VAKVLVTGGAGFIGSHLCDRLVAQGDEVVVLDDFSAGRRENIQHLRDRVEVIEDSVLNIAAHAQSMRGVTRIYHLAALISSHDSLREPEAYIHVNLIGLLRLLAVARTLPGVRIVFASSSTIYGNSAEPTRAEDAPAAPLTMYAVSKYAGEQALAVSNKLHGLDFVSLRLFNVYGPRQSPDHPYANVTCKFSHAAALGQTARLYGDGKQSRDFIYIDDAVDAFLLVSAWSKHRVYNVGTGFDTSIAELLAEVQRLSGRPLLVTQCEPWPNDIRAIRADISRLKTEFGFSPRVSLADGLRRTIQWFRDNAATRVLRT